LTDILEIFKALEELAPPELAERWDNCGLQVGPAGGEIRRILLSLDVTLPVAEEAAEIGAELIVSHHPLIFTPLQRIDGATAVGKLLYYLVTNRIAVFSIHTSLDSARGGVNDALADLIGIRNTTPMKLLTEGTGIGRIGDLSNYESGTVLAARLKSSLGLREIRVSGDIGGGVRRVALCSGSGGDLLGTALEQKADTRPLEKREDCPSAPSEISSETIRGHCGGYILKRLGTVPFCLTTWLHWDYNTFLEWRISICSTTWPGFL
jgi:dinuclear metal center YbgI/SA1388 family protein